MALFTKITSVSEIKELITGMFLKNEKTKANKIAPNGVLSGLFYGIAKIGQKAMKDIANVEARLFVQEATGDGLDNIAYYRGVGGRLGSLPSTTYVRLVGDTGTTYTVGGTTFRSGAYTFYLEQDETIGDSGFIYAKVKCGTAGLFTNVKAGTINKLDQIPNGHIAVFNEYKASGGRDEEDDELYRNRIINTVNLVSQSTREGLTERMRLINANILKIWFAGREDSGRQIVKISTQNTAQLTVQELEELYDGIKDYLTISDSFLIGSTPTVKLENAVYKVINFEMRIDYDKSVDIDEIRQAMQIAVQKTMDHNYFVLGSTVNWETAFIACSTTYGIRSIQDSYFSPRTDIATTKFELPVVGAFTVMDKDGNILSSNNGSISPTFYPNN